MPVVSRLYEFCYVVFRSVCLESDVVPSILRNPVEDWRPSEGAKKIT